MSLMCPIAESGENQEVVPALTSDRVPTLNPESLLPQVVEAFLSSQIPNPKTARGYRRHILAALDMMAIERFPEIQPGNLMDFKAELMAKKTVGNASKSQALTAMRSFLEWGSALGGHLHDPPTKGDHMLESIHYLTLDQAKTLLEPKTLELEVLISVDCQKMRLLLVPAAGECQDYIRSLGGNCPDCEKTLGLIDLLIDTCPESRPIIAAFAHEAAKK
jgi:hypothetical protein